MKKLWAFMLTLLMCIGMLMIFSPADVQAAKQEGDIAGGVYKEVDWRITAEGELIIGNGTEQTFTYRNNLMPYETWPWYRYRTQIKTGRFDGKVYGNGSMLGMFYDCSKLTSLDLSGFDTSNVTTMQRMFYNCSSLTSLDVSNFNTSKVTDTSWMFTGCSKLTSLDLSGFDTSNVTTMQSMFDGCRSLTSLDVSKFDTSNVMNMCSMFYYCSSLTSLDVSKFDTSNVTNTSWMFSGCSKLTSLDVSGFDTSNVTTMHSMFYNCSSLTSLDVSKFDTSKVTDMGSMFYKCSSLTSLDVSNFNTSKVGNMDLMFYNCSSLTSLDVSKFDTSNVTTMQRMFYNCSSLASLDVSNFNTRKVTNMSWMFSGCSKLTSLDVTNFDTNNVTDMNGMNGMFENCASLTSLDLSSFETPKTVSMTGIFKGCSKLEKLNISNFDMITSKSNTGDFFSGCNLLKSIVLGDRFSLIQQARPYQGAFMEPIGDEYTGKWIREDKAFGPYTSAELRDNYTSEMAGTWVWELKPTEYTISFEAGEGATGAMAPVNAPAGEDFILPANQFVNFGYDFDHWDDGNGHTYEDKTTIPANTYAADKKVTLTAVWKKRDTSVSMENGEFEFQIRAGEKATFKDIPAGTSYQVYELTPDGWVLVQQENASGVIEALEESAAAFWNKYQPGVTTVQFSGLKTLDGHPASEGSYKFELLENGKVIDTTTTQDGGFIQFKVIEYDAAGDHTYTIREVEPDDDSVDYDTHEETVNVKVTDDGKGNLSSEVTYDEDGIKFENHTRPGILRITKNADVTEANKDDKFTFEITFSNENGMPISDNIYWYVENGAEGSADYGAEGSAD